MFTVPSKHTFECEHAVQADGTAVTSPDQDGVAWCDRVFDAQPVVEEATADAVTVSATCPACGGKVEETVEAPR